MKLAYLVSLQFFLHMLWNRTFGDKRTTFFYGLDVLLALVPIREIHSVAPSFLHLPPDSCGNGCSFLYNAKISGLVVFCLT